MASDRSGGGRPAGGHAAGCWLRRGRALRRYLAVVSPLPLAAPVLASPVLASTVLASTVLASTVLASTVIAVGAVDIVDSSGR